MKYLYNISLAIVLLLFPTLVIVNFLQLAYLYSPNLDFNFLQMPENTYFGINSIRLISMDLQTPFLDIIDRIVTTSNFIYTSIIDFFETLTSGEFIVIDFQEFGWSSFDILGTIKKVAEMIYQLAVLPFGILYIILNIWSFPFVAVANLWRVFFVAISGGYNLPLPTGQEYTIPNWEDVWNFTFNSLNLLR